MGLGLKRPDDAVGSAAPAILIGLFVAFGGVLFGYLEIDAGEKRAEGATHHESVGAKADV
ncbi:Major facilitator superfamily domain general substrate transporter [Penicillium brevicompactum]|uniref:Major facilitator superfamily domain general substrate transporter n=1 Tax=Penicillium brevicompactum TaxID=5074 RepID=UPI002542640A|nr:Major facilitator superfamily domain general substrate transporter [Penicillium brevicompactum]KAJ5336065.1 Major facilitator superfamily domain general substrate transporter [Penicillium brevicompactum]